MKKSFKKSINVGTKARYWLLTIPAHCFTPYLPRGVASIRGQLERSESQYLHWQVFCSFTTQQRLKNLRDIFGDIHCEPSNSKAAEDYVWKEETSVEGTRFELGTKALQRNSSKDWATILDDAKSGRFDNIPPDVYIRCYGSLKRIACENATPAFIVRSATLYWGPTGTGKSRTAWENAGLSAYPKDPMSKFWDGYRGHTDVVIDEFRGSISISHLLRWLDRYPVLVEVKGSSVVLNAERFWITSNVPPERWYPDIDTLTLDALLRRIKVIEIK